MSVEQISNIGATVTVSGFAAFLAANEIYLKWGLGALTAAAAITTILVNIRKLRKTPG